MIGKMLGPYRVLDKLGAGGVAHSLLAQMTFAQGDPGRALTLYREALRLLEVVGDHPEVARVHCETGWTALAASDPRAATESFLARAGTVAAHPIDPGVADRIAALKASIPKGTLDGLVARASTLTAAGVLAMAGGRP